MAEKKITIFVEPKSKKKQEPPYAYHVEFDQKLSLSIFDGGHDWRLLAGFKTKKEGVDFVYKLQDFVSSFDCEPQYHLCYMRIRKLNPDELC